MTRTRFTYQRLLDLLGGDRELIARLIEEGEIERRDEIMAVVDLDRVLIARTLLREIAFWPGPISKRGPFNRHQGRGSLPVANYPPVGVDLPPIRSAHSPSEWEGPFATTNAPRASRG